MDGAQADPAPEIADDGPGGRANEQAIDLLLRDGFRLVHEPLKAADHGALAVGDLRLAQSLAARLSHSDGGAFLITGFRGVGKTTSVREALRLLGQETSKTVVDVEISLARTVNPEELLFEVLRRLYEKLDETGVRDLLTAATRTAIDVAYARTSYSIRDTRSLQDERSRGVEVGGGIEVQTSGGPTVKLPGLKLTAARKRSASRALELSFLAYSTSDAEHDLTRILGLLRRPDAAGRVGWRRLAAWLRLVAPSEPLDVRVVIVLDEVDKLTAAEGGQERFENLIGALKNVLGVSGAHFVMVAGVDSHDAWLRDVAGPDSIYRSVFAWQGYAPCVWGEAAEIVHRAAPSGDSDVREHLARYLEFTSRGILRSLHAELNELVSWDSGAPRVVVAEEDVARVELLADLQSWTSELFLRNEYSDLLAQPVDEDRVRLSAYYAVDWILRNGATPFDVSKLIDPGGGAIHRILRPSRHVLEDLLETLVGHGFLEKRDRNAPTATRLGPREHGQEEPVYWLSEEAHARLGRVARGGGRGRAQVRDTVAPEVAFSSALGASASAAPLILRDKGYQLERVLGVGGVGTVWEAADRDGRQVAIKIITSGARRRHLKQRLIGLTHRGLVRTRDVLEDDEVLAIVMDLVDGVNLGRVTLPMTQGEIARVMNGVLDVLIYIHASGLARLDLKPDNIFLPRRQEDGAEEWSASNPVIVDLDTLIVVRDPGEVHEFYGTEAYAAPESLRQGLVDIRYDIYSLGITALALFGEREQYVTLDPDNAHRPDRTMLRRPPDPQRVQATPALRAVLARAIAPNPEDRFQTPLDMQRELRATPELTPTVWE